MKEDRHKGSHVVEFYLSNVWIHNREIDTECRLVVSRVWGKGEWGITTNEYSVFPE